MQPSELLFLILFIGFLWYWMDGTRAKEVAINAGRRICRESQVDFLDGTVVMQKVRMKRDGHGYVRLCRWYHFEFSSDGSQRYSGRMTLMGKHLIDSSLDVHRTPDSYIH